MGEQNKAHIVHFAQKGGYSMPQKVDKDGRAITLTGEVVSPDPDLISKRTAEIRKDWDEYEHRKRANGGSIPIATDVIQTVRDPKIN